MPSSRIASILRSARELLEPIRVHGATPTARALIAARYAATSSSRSPIVVICPDDDAASDFIADLQALTERVEGVHLRSIHFPTWEQSPYSPITPSLRTRLARTGVLTTLSLERPEDRPQILVT